MSSHRRAARGLAYAFLVYHLLKVRDPYEAFPIQYEDV